MGRFSSGWRASWWCGAQGQRSETGGRDAGESVSEGTSKDGGERVGTDLGVRTNNRDMVESG